MLTISADRFLVLGHRGASAHAPENTPAAFSEAAAHGADGVELDVRRTADDRLVVHHDPVVEGAVIRHLTLPELRRIAPQVATLDEAMEACDGLIVNVEIKNSPDEADFDATDELAAMTVDWIDRHGWKDRVIVSSFNPATVDRVRHLSADLATGQLVMPGSDAATQLILAADRGHQALHPHVSSLQDPHELARAASGLGMWVLAWTVNDPATIRSLRAAGITGVITDDPALARSAIEPSP